MTAGRLVKTGPKTLGVGDRPGGKCGPGDTEEDVDAGTDDEAVNVRTNHGHDVPILPKPVVVAEGTASEGLHRCFALFDADKIPYLAKLRSLVG